MVDAENDAEPCNKGNESGCTRVRFPSFSILCTSNAGSNPALCTNRLVNFKLKDMDIKLKITRGEDQELRLTAKTMNELVAKIIEWQDYDDYVKTVKQFKKPPTEAKLKKEKESGWYYIK